MTEIDEKVERIRQYLESENLAAVLLTSRRNFAWATNGATNHVRLGSEIGVASLLILKNGKRYIVAGNNEMPRMLEEEVKDLGYQPAQFNWYEAAQKQQLIEQLVSELGAEQMIGSDIPLPNTKLVEDSFARLRYCLTDGEIARYRQVGLGCAQAVEEVCRRLQPGMSELEIEGLTSEALLRRNLRPTVILVGADDRIYKYRHPVPTERPLERYCMIAINAQRWGLIGSLTRFVHFGPAPEDLVNRHGVVCRINAQFIAHTKQGTKASDFFVGIKDWYAQAGYSQEWCYHHQGGAIGYREREWIIAPDLNETINDRQAFAWNPTIAGAKDEDTILVLGDSVETITQTSEWPTVEVTVDGQTFQRPAILVR